MRRTAKSDDSRRHAAAARPLFSPSACRHRTGPANGGGRYASTARRSIAAIAALGAGAREHLDRRRTIRGDRHQRADRCSIVPPSAGRAVDTRRALTRNARRAAPRWCWRSAATRLVCQPVGRHRMHLQSPHHDHRLVALAAVGLILVALELAASGGFYVIFFGIAALAIGALHLFELAGPLWCAAPPLFRPLRRVAPRVSQSAAALAAAGSHRRPTSIRSSGKRRSPLEDIAARERRPRRAARHGLDAPATPAAAIVRRPALRRRPRRSPDDLSRA